MNYFFLKLSEFDCFTGHSVSLRNSKNFHLLLQGSVSCSDPYMIVHNLYLIPDRLVIMGGDGTVSEIMNVLMRETQTKVGIDFNDSNREIKTTEFPIGVIPTGQIQDTT